MRELFWCKPVVSQIPSNFKIIEMMQAHVRLWMTEIELFTYISRYTLQKSLEYVTPSRDVILCIGQGNATEGAWP
jgi:hypothetical protein